MPMPPAIRTTGWSGRVGMTNRPCGRGDARCRLPAVVGSDNWRCRRRRRRVRMAILYRSGRRAPPGRTASTTCRSPPVSISSRCSETCCPGRKSGGAGVCAVQAIETLSGYSVIIGRRRTVLVPARTVGVGHRGDVAYQRAMRDRTADWVVVLVSDEQVVVAAAAENGSYPGSPIGGGLPPSVFGDNDLGVEGGSSLARNRLRPFRVDRITHSPSRCRVPWRARADVDGGFRGAVAQDAIPRCWV